MATAEYTINYSSLYETTETAPPQFKVGDRVKVIGGGWTFTGEAGTVVGVSTTSSFKVQVNGQRSPWNILASELLLVSSKSGCNSDCSICNQSIKKEKEKDMSLTNKLRNMVRSADEKLLIKHGVLDECGEVEDTDLIVEYAFRASRDAIVADLKKLDADEKADKKASK